MRITGLLLSSLRFPLLPLGSYDESWREGSSLSAATGMVPSVMFGNESDIPNHLLAGYQRLIVPTFLVISGTLH